MTTVLDANVHNVAVESSFDDCQTIVKTLFNDESFRAKHSLAAINSINWARILAQVPAQCTRGHVTPTFTCIATICSSTHYPPPPALPHRHARTHVRTPVQSRM